MYIYDESMDTTGCPHTDITIEDDGVAHTLAVCTACHSHGPVIEELWSEREKLRPPFAERLKAISLRRFDAGI